MLILVYLPKIFSSVADLFHFDPLHLLSAGTVLILEPSAVSGVSQVCSCVYLTQDHYNEKCAKIIWSAVSRRQAYSFNKAGS